MPTIESALSFRKNACLSNSKFVDVIVISPTLKAAKNVRANIALISFLRKHEESVCSHAGINCSKIGSVMGNPLSRMGLILA